jgi:hypothetical protein
MDTRADTEAVAKRKISVPAWHLTPVVEPVASYGTGRATSPHAVSISVPTNDVTKPNDLTYTFGFFIRAKTPGSIINS